jgi:hypothetical protein
MISAISGYRQASNNTNDAHQQSKTLQHANRGEEKMVKRILLGAMVAVGGLMVSTPNADAAVVYRPIAPVRRVAARAVLPPYPVARRAAFGPVYRPYAYPAYGPVIYGGGFYGPGVGITVW